MTAKYVVSELCARNFYHEMRCTDTAAAEIPKKTPNDWADTNLLGHDSLRGMGGRRVGQSVSSQIPADCIRSNASGELSASRAESFGPLFRFSPFPTNFRVRGTPTGANFRVCVKVH